MKSLQDFNKAKNLIIESYEELKNSEYLPLHYENIVIDIDSINEFISNLTNEKFIISICGQIKVGKSTFLNDLIFEDLILPSASTPETAKLTELNFGKTSFTINFYSQNEWDNLKSHKIKTDDGRDTNYYDEFLKPNLQEISKQTGEPIYPEQIISKGSITGNNLSDLKDYISAKGKYTPFVKMVKLDYPSEILKSVTIVDTPGINDPNIMRSKVTENWIGKSDAIIFLMFAGQPLTSQDVKFIQDYLLPVPTDKIIIGLSKIDVVEDYSRPQKYVHDSLKGDLEGFGKNINNKNIYPISPMFSLFPKLFKKFENDEIKLTNDQVQDINFQLNKRAKGKQNILNLIDNSGFMVEFKKAIEEHLIKNKGEDLLNSHSRKIISIFEYKLKNIELEKNRLSERLKTINLSDQELIEKEKSLDEIKLKLQNVETEVAARTEKVEKEIYKEIGDIIFEANKKLKESVQSLINNKEIDYLVSNMIWDTKEIIENYIRKNMYSEIKNIMEKKKSDCEDIQTDIKSNVNNFNLFSTAFINSLFGNFNVSDTVRKIEELITTNLSSDLLEKLKESKYLFWTDKEQTKINMNKVVNELFMSEKGTKNIINGSVDVLIEDIRKLFAEMISQINSEISEKDKLVRGLIEQRGSFTPEVNKINDDLNSFQLEISKLSNKITHIKEKIGLY